MVTYGLELVKSLFNVDYRFIASDIDFNLKKELNFIEEAENAKKIRKMFE